MLCENIPFKRFNFRLFSWRDINIQSEGTRTPFLIRLHRHGVELGPGSFSRRLVGHLGNRWLSRLVANLVILTRSREIADRPSSAVIWNRWTFYARPPGSYRTGDACCYITPCSINRSQIIFDITLTFHGRFYNCEIFIMSIFRVSNGARI